MKSNEEFLNRREFVKLLGPGLTYCALAPGAAAPPTEWLSSSGTIVRSGRCSSGRSSCTGISASRERPASG